MPSKRRLLRKMVQPWFQEFPRDLFSSPAQQQEKDDDAGPSNSFDLLKDFEQEFVDWLLNALRESDGMRVREELLNEKNKIDVGTLRELLQFRLAEDEQDNGVNAEDNEQVVGNKINTRNGKVIVEGEEAYRGGHHSHLNNQGAAGAAASDCMESDGQKNAETAEKYKTASPLRGSITWFAEDRKGTVRRRKLLMSKESVTVPSANELQRSLSQLLSEFRIHQQKQSEEQAHKPSSSSNLNNYSLSSESDESGIDSLAQDVEDSDGYYDDDDDLLDKTLVPANFSDPE